MFMDKQTILLSLILVLTPITAIADEVSLLEAFHIAEIHTAQAVDSYYMQSYREDEHYVLEVPVLDVPVNGTVKRVWVHKGHGRVSKIEHITDGKSTLEYHWSGIKVVAHRGGVGLGVPENTLPAIQKAIEAGAQLIEIDIRETKDGHMVLMHDSTVDRTTNGSGRVDQLTLDEIRALDAGSWLDEKYKGTKVPTLEEALQLMKGKIDPDLDFKEGSIEKLVDIVNKVGVADQCTHNGSLERNQKILAVEPRIFIRPTIDTYTDIPAIIRTLFPPLLNMDWKAVSERTIQDTHIFGAKAFVNCLETADSLLYAKTAALAGADYIQTDYPDKVIELLKEMELMYDKKWDIGVRNNPLTNPKLDYPLR